MPDGRNADNASFDFRAWDQSAGTAGSLADASLPGPTQPFSVASDTASIVVTAVNDAPTLDNAGDLTLVDVAESDANPAGDSVASILASAGGDPIADVDAGALQGIAVTSAFDSNGSWQYSTDNGTIWTAFGPVSDASAVLLDTAARVRFVPDTGYVGPAGDLAFRAWDQSTGANGQTGIDASSSGLTTAFSVGVETVATNVSALNAAPVLTPSGPGLTAITEDETRSSGDTVSAIVGASISDTNRAALQGLAVTGLSSGNGSWQYSTDAGTIWTTVGSVSNTSALLLRDVDRLRFVPDTLNADTASFDFRAWDRTSGIEGTLADASDTGGTTAFSPQSDTASISVSAQNDAPNLTGDGFLADVPGDSTDPSGATIASLLARSFSDVDVAASFSGIAVVSNGSDPAIDGAWQYSSNGGADWFVVGSVGDDTSALSLSVSTLLRFVPDPDFTGIPAPLVLRAMDDSHTGGFSSTAGGSESRVNVDAASRGGTSAISASTSAISTSVGNLTLNPSEIEDPATPQASDPPPTDDAPDSEPPDDPVTADDDEPNESEGPIGQLIVEPGYVGNSGTLLGLSDPAGAAAAAVGLPTVATGPDLTETARDASEDGRADSSAANASLHLLQDIYTGRSDGEASDLLSLIFQNQRGIFLGDLDAAQEDIQALMGMQTQVVSSSIAVTSGLSVGYVLWLTRGGLLVASLLSSLPAWRLIDPIPVLAQLRLEGESDDEEDESLDSLVSKGRPEALDVTDEAASEEDLEG